MVGFPWAIPMEFPIYQWIVAAFGCSSTSALDEIGRLVSYAFWIGCFWPARLISRRLFGANGNLYFWIFAALFASAPIYLFWARTFMMETAALFFTLMYLTFALEMSMGRNLWRDALLTGVFLTLALLQKSTTVLPLLLFALVYLWAIRGEVCERWVASIGLWKGAAAYLIPLAIGFAWVKYSDHVKMANAMGAHLTSAALGSWNFGTIEARMSGDLWGGVIWRRVAAENIASYLGAVLIVAGAILAPLRRRLILCGIGLYLLFFMVFENLLFQHLYYPASNTVYLIFGLAVSIGGLIEARPRAVPLVSAAFALVVVVNLYGFFNGQLFAAESHQPDSADSILTVAKFVRERTPADAAIIVYGADWSSEVPYYAERRAFAVPKWFPGYLDVLDAPVKYLGQQPGAILVCWDGLHDQDLSRKLSADYIAWDKTSLGMCDVYLHR